jgi:hypothetical protein
MIERKCKHCGTKFTTSLAKIKDNRGKFCSIKCRDDSKKNRIIIGVDVDE